MIVDPKDLQVGYVKSETHNHIATIEFFHPKDNALPAKIQADLAHEIMYAANNNDVRVIILQSAGTSVFCGGTLPEELALIHTEKDAVQFFSGFANLINTMRKCPKCIIARVHGTCTGSGVGLAAAADYAIAVEGAEIRLNELTLGFGPFVVGPAIQRKLGTAAFGQLTLDAAMWRNGDWARRKGLYAELHPNKESMEESIARLSNSLSHTSPEAMAAVKRMLWEGTEHWDHLLPERAQISGKLILTEFTRKKISS